MGARVRIVIPTLKAGPLLADCLQSLRGQNFQDFEVVVVLNGPGPEPLPSVPVTGLRWMRTAVNLGFGEAINRGFAEATADYLLALNDDTQLDPACLSELVNAMDRHPDAGMGAPLIVRSADGLVDSAGMALARDCSSKQRGSGRPIDTFRAEEPVLFASGCAVIYRRMALEHTGGFDPAFFLYCEDTDLGLRLQRRGWRCWFIPAARIEHRYSVTSGAGSARKVYFAERNRLAVAVKNLPWDWCLGAIGWSIVRYLWHIYFLGRGRGYFGQQGDSAPHGSFAAAVLRAHWDFLRWLPALLAARRTIAGRSGPVPPAWRQLLRHGRISLKDVARA